MNQFCKVSLKQVITNDIKRYIIGNEIKCYDLIRNIVSNECLFYLIVFRISQRILKVNSNLLRIPIKIIVINFFLRFISIFFGIDINLKAKIGEGFYIGHIGGIHIGPVKIGKYCNISQGVTIGQGLGRNMRDRYGLPEIGDYVYVGPNAVIAGKIIIGNHVSIGANSFVSKNIPDNSIVVGNPARVVGKQEENINILNR